MFSIILSYSILFSFFVLSLIGCFFAASLIIGLFMARGVPFISSPRYDIESICSAVELKPGEIIYDLGCGKANLLTVASRKFGARGVGYEISLLPYVWAKLRIWFFRADVQMRLADFFKADLGEADVVFCYLFPEIMAKLEPKFRSQLKPGSRVVSYAFQLPNIAPIKVVDGNEPRGLFEKIGRTTGKIYVYQF
jgi:SAM-dependent methyltransferase